MCGDKMVEFTIIYFVRSHMVLLSNIESINPTALE